MVELYGGNFLFFKGGRTIQWISILSSINLQQRGIGEIRESSAYSIIMQKISCHMTMGVTSLILILQIKIQQSLTNGFLIRLKNFFGEPNYLRS